jgi:siroheme synthase (precorrin-2 oxidase/ferrochelatase)
MLSVVLTKPQKVLIVGAGSACAIKLKILKKTLCDITIVSNEFKYDLGDILFKKIKDDFYNLKDKFFEPFSLIYIAIKVDNTSMIDKLSRVKMINVLSNPKLSNFIHPCSRDDDDIQISVHNLHKANPKKACKLAKEFIEYKRQKDDR